LNQGELAKALGVRRETVNAAVKALKFRGLIEITGGSGAAQVVRFLLHGWMPSTCALNAQVEGCEPVRQSIKACAESEQQPVIKTRSACATIKQVSLGIEKRELREERKRSSSSLGWGDS
jgi:DNA-binding transcriptional regulator LsrR (DeoR family)